MLCCNVTQNKCICALAYVTSGLHVCTAGTLFCNCTQFNWYYKTLHTLMVTRQLHCLPCPLVLHFVPGAQHLLFPVN